MINVTGITDYPNQKFTLIGEEKEQIQVVLRYMGFVQGWKIDVKSGDFEARGMLLVNSPNILRQWRKKLSYGLMVASTDNLDPTYLNDFSSGRIQLYLLNRDDVASIETAFQ